MRGFRRWLEVRLGEDPKQMRARMIDYLDLRLDPDQGMTISMDDLGPRTVEHLRTKIKGWEQLTDPQKVAALGVLDRENATLGDLADAIAGGPHPMPGPEAPSAEGL